LEKSSQLDKDPKLSIIIPTFNSESTIRRCLLSLISQSYPREKYEIILVDDGSEDRTVQVANEVGTDIIILRKQRGGPGDARNVGVKQARGKFLGFIDSDCEAKKDWIKTIIEELQTLEAIGGPISNGNPHSKNAWAEYFIEFGGFDKNKKRSLVRFFPTCNGACRRDIFLKVGGFNKTPTGEDVLLGNSLTRAGVKLTFIPELQIHHFCRTTVNKVLSNTKKLGKGLVITRKIAPSLPYSKLTKSRWFISLIFFGKIGTSLTYAIKGKMLRKYVISFPYVILGIASYCSGVWGELEKTNIDPSISNSKINVQSK